MVHVLRHHRNGNVSTFPYVYVSNLDLEPSTFGRNMSEFHSFVMAFFENSNDIFFAIFDIFCSGKFSVSQRFLVLEVPTDQTVNDLFSLEFQNVCVQKWLFHHN